ncbi:MAG: plastocyanin/azurin family copper-binding protein [Actinomycetota bacterium]
MRTKILGSILALALAACADGGADPATPVPQEPVEDPTITIADMEFQNGSVTIEAGTTVTWVWEDAPVEHNVAFEDTESPLQAEGTWTRTFEEVGTYEYRCAPHPFMTGTITVVEPDTA